MAPTQHEKQPDGMLVIAAILGDLRSFDVLALRYRAAAYRVAQVIAGNELAEDIVQEALLLAFKALPSIEGPDKFASWLYAITRHAAYRVGQRSRQELAQRVELDEALLENSAALAQPFKPSENFETAWVRAGVEQLGEDYRLILQLRFYDEMPLRRIADFLDLPLTTVKWRLHRAKQLLRQQLAPVTRQPAAKTESQDKDLTIRRIVMEREQELKKLINVLHRTARAAVRVQWMQAGENETRFAREQFNRILARLGELDPNIKSVFAPLPDDSTLTTVALACRQVVSYYEDEIKLEDEWWSRRGFAFGIGARPGQCKDFNFEELGNWVRDIIQEGIGSERERRAGRKNCG